MKLPRMPTREDLPLLTAAEASARGMSQTAVRWKVTSGHWQRIHRGVYVTHAGTLDWPTRASAALLAAGDRAAVADVSAAYMWGLLPEPGPMIDLVLPRESRIATPAGARVRYADTPIVLWRRWPPRTSVESTLVDSTRVRSLDASLAMIGRALQGRLTTSDRILDELRRHRRHSLRRALSEALELGGSGAESALEFRYARDVEARHGLPTGIRQLRQRIGGIGRSYDVGYDDNPLLVELDGLLFHQGSAARVDRSKTNAATRLGRPLLRYGWIEVWGAPCQVSAEVIMVATRAGARWSPHPCRPGCPVGQLSEELAHPA